MQLTRETPEFRYLLKGVGPEGILVNEAVIARSFLLTPARLVQDWRPRSVAELEPADLEAALALAPALMVLGTGPRQVFPPPAVLAAMLTRGIGIEVMDNAAAARTFNVLASEGRAVVAGFLVPG
ncbi:MAG TPA: MTH938/NDUFAF3 family protein [Arenimonas sp.]|jgi:uncharacterized protein|nr:MTH938/NDUFAF3 family protein [Arenimonas sp.]